MHRFSKVREEGEGKFPSKVDKYDKIHVIIKLIIIPKKGINEKKPVNNPIKSE